MVLQLDPFPPTQPLRFPASNANLARLPARSLSLHVHPGQTQVSTPTAVPITRHEGNREKSLTRTSLKMHKAFPCLKGLNGIHVLYIFSGHGVHRLGNASNRCSCRLA